MDPVRKRIDLLILNRVGKKPKQGIAISTKIAVLSNNHSLLMLDAIDRLQDSEASTKTSNLLAHANND